VCSFRNKCAPKSCKHFHLTFIMYLRYRVKLKMLTAHMLPSSCYRKKLQNLSYLNGSQPPNLPDLNPLSWLQRVENTARKGIQNTNNWSGAIDDATGEWLPQWNPAWRTPFSVAVSVRPDQWYVFCSTPFLAVFPTRCNQLDSNLAN